MDYDFIKFLGAILGLILIIALIGTIVFGIIVSFRSHPITGILSLCIEPLPLVIGISNIFYNYPLEDRITEFHQNILNNN